MHPAALLLLHSAASAQVPVLVSRFEVQQATHQTAADRLPALLSKRLRTDPDLEVLLPSDVPWIEDNTNPDRKSVV